MKKNSYKKILLVLLVLVLITSLTGCSNADTYDRPLGSFSDEENIFEWLLVWPIAWIMSTMGNLFNNSFGWGLIFGTIIVRLITVPIYAGSQSSMFKMQLMQPDMARVQAKYAGRSDEESRRKQSAEMQAVYKKHKVKPASCLLIFLQMPVFSAMYTVINRIGVEGGSLSLSNTIFLGFNLNSSAFSGDVKDRIFTVFLSLIVVGTMYLSQHLAKKKPSYSKNIPNKNPQAQMSEKTMKMIMIVPLVVMGWIALNSAAMALYWVVGNIFQVIQSTIIRKKNELRYEKENSLNMITNKDLKEAKKYKNDIIDVPNSK